MAACQQYVVFGGRGERSGSSPNYWLFTGEPEDSDDYTYDHANRLAGAVINSVASSATYNGDGLRMNHSVSRLVEAGSGADQQQKE